MPMQMSKIFDPNTFDTAPESSPRIADPSDINVSGIDETAAVKITATKKGDTPNFSADELVSSTNK